MASHDSIDYAHFAIGSLSQMSRPQNDASLATNKQSNAEVKTKTNLATLAGGEGKTLFKMAAKHGIYNHLLEI